MHAIVNDARHVEGVVAVRGRLSYPPAAPVRANGPEIALTDGVD